MLHTLNNTHPEVFVRYTPVSETLNLHTPRKRISHTRVSQITNPNTPGKFVRYTPFRLRPRKFPLQATPPEVFGCGTRRNATFHINPALPRIRYLILIRDIGLLLNITEINYLILTLILGNFRDFSKKNFL